jgi:hypothetical protein
VGRGGKGVGREKDEERNTEEVGREGNDKKNI